jgi:hypothetical protein
MSTEVAEMRVQFEWVSEVIEKGNKLIWCVYLTDQNTK